MGLGQRLAVAATLVFLAAAAEARKPELLHPSTGAKVRKAAKDREKVSVPDVSLGRPSLDTLELEPMDLWTPGAKVVVHGAGAPQSLDPRPAQYFRGVVKGEPQSAVFLAVTDEQMHGLVVVGEKRFALGTAKRVDRNGAVDEDDTLAVRELAAEDEPSAGNWTCDVDSKSNAALRPLTPKATAALRDVVVHEGALPTASYRLNLAIETDYELFLAFNTVPAITAYIESLVGNASVVFQRDLNTTLTIGNLHVYVDPADPWTINPVQGTITAMDQLTEVWHLDTARSQVLRSAVVMVSGKSFNAGRAFQGTLCGADYSCGPAGAACGSETFSGGWGGAYAFCGTNGQPSTTVPDPTVTRNGVTYAMANANDYWMLYLFTHELGHLANGPHTNCVQLAFEERVAYNVQRAYVDECMSVDAGCFFQQPSVPAELGTIMSGCNALVDSHGDRASRYIFWEPNRPSAKMFPILRNGIDGVTPDGTIRLGTYANPNQEDPQPLTCEANRTARVPTCPNCTYAWTMTGGSITSSLTAPNITYTPTVPLITLTVTITQPSGCAITTSRQITTACSSLGAPITMSATANGATHITVTWNTVSGAARYEVARSSDGTNWTPLGNTAGTTYLDSTGVHGTVYLYRVRAFDGAGFPGPWSGTDFAAAFDFTDAVLSAQNTTIRAAHISELRTAVNALRALTGLQAATFTDPVLTNARIRRIHVEELRARLAEAVAAQARPTVTYTDPVLADASLVRASHVAEIRAALR